MTLATEVHPSGKKYPEKMDKSKHENMIIMAAHDIMPGTKTLWPALKDAAHLMDRKIRFLVIS